jgi:signal peptidase I
VSDVPRPAAPRVPWWRVRVSPARQALGVALLLLAGAFFFAMFGLGMRFYSVGSFSMLPTLSEGDRIVAFPAREYGRGDLVVLRDPVDPESRIVKRIIALAGDTVEIYGGALRVNGVYISEPYRPDPIHYTLAQYVVPERSVFVLGDNANLSNDSHNWAAFKDTDTAGRVVPEAVPSSLVVGRARYRYFPFGRIGSLRSYPIEIYLAT